MSRQPRLKVSLDSLHRRQRRAGTIIVLTAFLLAILVAAAAFTIDIAYMHLVRSELQHSTDAAARAASNAIGKVPELAEAREIAIDVAAANTVAGESLLLGDDDVIFGKSILAADGSFTFDEFGSPKNSVRVFGRRTDSSPSGSVALYLGGLLGRDRYQPELFSTATRIDRDICIVVDRSGSMAWDESSVEWQYPLELQGLPWQDNYITPPHPTGSRWAGLVEAVLEFESAIANTIEEELLSLVSYSNEYTYSGVSAETVTTHTELTPSSEVIANKISAIGNEPIIGGTNISAGLDSGVAAVTNIDTNRPHAFKMVILMTDGVWNAGREPALAAEDAADLGVIVHTITFSAGANQADMIEVAEITGGRHYHAPTREELKKAFAELAYSVPVVLIH